MMDSILRGRGTRLVHDCSGRALFPIPAPCTCPLSGSASNRRESENPTMMKQDKSGLKPVSYEQCFGAQAQGQRQAPTRLVDTRFTKTVAFPVLWCSWAHRESGEYLNPLTGQPRAGRAEMPKIGY